MKAVVLRQPRQLDWADVPEPRLTAEHDVLIQVEACGICGSDLRYWEGDNPWARTRWAATSQTRPILFSDTNMPELWSRLTRPHTDTWSADASECNLFVTDG